MLSISLIQETINELIEQETTLANCQKLACLYTVLDHQAKTVTEEELDDILPAYRRYIEIKMRYQTGSAALTDLEQSMEKLCIEIAEFVKTLYSCTECCAERNLIKDTLTNILESL